MNNPRSSEAASTHIDSITPDGERRLNPEVRAKYDALVELGVGAAVGVQARFAEEIRPGVFQDTNGNLIDPELVHAARLVFTEASEPLRIAAGLYLQRMSE